MDGIRFTRPATARVAVVVLAFRTREPLAACLSALAGQETTQPYEVVVVLNGAAPEVVTFVDDNVDGAVVVRSPHNRGFAGGCNAGAASASATDHLVFLNDDAVPEPSWLEELVAFADTRPRAGAVAGLVLFPDGTVQEAGGVVWREGTTAVVGRGQPPDDPEVSYARQVDYASACALLVRRPAWEELGGFDQSYFPGYYEDVDLCLRLRERSWQVWYTPTARVMHAESASAGSAKAVMFRTNELRFQRRWLASLTDHVAHGDDPQGALPAATMRVRGGARRVLVIDDHAPTAGMGAGFDRMLTVLQALERRNTRVAFYSSEPSTRPSDLGRIGIEVVDDLDRFVGAGHVYLDAIVASRPNNLDLALRARERHPSAAVVYDAEALFFRRYERWAALLEDEEERRDALQGAARFRDIEESVAAHVDAVVTISHEERDWFVERGASCPITLVPPFPESLQFTQAGFAERRGALFVAGWAAGPSSPNAHGLQWFARSVLPEVRSMLPWVSVGVTGGNPPDHVRGLRSSALQLLGHVDDMAELYGGVRVAIVPILWGAGVKVKTLEALAHGVPAVSTVIGAEGLPPRWRDQVDVVEDEAEFADRLHALLTDDSVWEARRAGIAALHAEHHFDLAKEWLDVIDQAMAHRLDRASRSLT